MKLLATRCVTPFVFLFALTASAFGEGDAIITHAGKVHSDVLAITVREGHVQLGQLVEYKARPGDEFEGQPNRTTVLVRNGKAVGMITGTPETPTRYVRLSDTYSGKRANRKLLNDASAWSISVGGKRFKVVKAFRKSRITDIAEANRQRPEVCFEHTVYLTCEQSIPDGKLIVETTDPFVGPYQSSLAESTRSNAIHVSLLGFRPDDPVKFAFVSCWMGDGGPVDYSTPTRFRVVAHDTDKAVFTGEATLCRKSDQPADHRGLQGTPDGRKVNYAGANSYLLDFSKLNQSGLFRVVVDGLGSSSEFPIRTNAYASTFDIGMEGLEAHRWGEDRKLRLVDGSTMTRPAAVPARHSKNSPIFKTSAIYKNANFADFEPGNTGPWKPEDSSLSIVGGFMDAGDFDRNHAHWKVGYYLLDLASKTAKSRPKWTNRLVENALWDVAFWAKLQSKDGAVPSAVEYSEHPRGGEPSWLNSLPVYVCAASRESNLHFAISASKAAATLRDVGRSEESKRFIAAATRAMDWFERQKFKRPDDKETALAQSDTEMLARVELWNATRLPRHRKQTLAMFDQRVAKPWSSTYPDGLLAMLTVLELPNEVSALSKTQRENMEGSVKRTIEMNYLDGSTRRSPFRALKNGWVGISFGNGAWPTTDSLSVIRAWRLFGDDEYLSAAVSGMAYCLGGNPNNMVYMTGLHERSVRNVLHCDTRYSGRRAPVGIPVYGPALSSDRGSAWPLNWHLSGDQTIYPAYESWPTYENVHEYWNWGVIMEYTVHQSHASAIYLAGMLDAR